MKPEQEKYWSEIIKAKCNGYELPLSLDVELIVHLISEHEQQLTLPDECYSNTDEYNMGWNDCLESIKGAKTTP